MKNFIKSFILLFLAILSLTLMSCDKKDNNSNNYLGRYVLTKYKVNDQELPLDNLSSYIELKENNIVIFYFSGSSLEGTYEISGENISITILDDTQEATISNGKIIREQNYDDKEYFEYTKGAPLSIPSENTSTKSSTTTSSDENFFGRYRLYSASVINDDLDEYVVYDSYLELQEDGKYLIGYSEYTLTGTFIISNDKITLISDGTEIEGQLIDKMIKITQKHDGATLNFTYIKESYFDNIPSSSYPTDELIGFWTPTKYVLQGDDYLSKNIIVLMELKENGLAKLTIIRNTTQWIDFGTYEYDGTNLTITFSDTPLIFTFDNEKLICSPEDNDSFLDAEFAKA